MQMYQDYGAGRRRLDSRAVLAQTYPVVTDKPEPFDETVAARRRRQCFFCDVDKSDEWIFVASLNTFVCKKCHDRINETSASKKEASGSS
jgi:hypothetical protein